LINAHPSFATLSSCSGRISLFDPNHEATLNSNNENNENNENNGNNENSNSVNMSNDTEAEAEEGIALQESEMDDQYIELDRVATTTAATGKGYGAWLITSHAQITPCNLFSALEDQSKSNSHHALIFKHEPLLLHVAASSLSRARQLLKIALDLGFRESGTVITPKRITVAIRSHSLALTVPIASKGRLRPNEEYMEELVKEANDRFVLNEDKLRRLEDMIEQTCFTIQEEVDVSLNRVDCTLEELPGLNLWGHTTLAIPASDGNGNLDIVAIGGYGTGPNGKQKSSSRSNKIFNLGRIDCQWHDAWSEVKIDQSNLQEEVNIGGFAGKRVALTAREGCASCILPLQLESPLIGIFGGRASPARPNNELLFLSYSSRGGASAGTLYSPMDVRGDIPEPRWGHSFTALSGKGGRLAVVVGGRNEMSIEPCMYVLSIGSDVDEGGTQSMYLMWDKISQTIPRFHHCASYISTQKKNGSDSDTETIIVQGGLSSTALITQEGTEQNMPSLAISLNAKERSCTIRECKESNIYPVFGGSMCTLSIFPEPIFFSSGGLASDAMKEETYQESFIKIVKYVEAEDLNLCPSIQIIPNTMQEISGNCIKFGSMVHHSCVELPPPQSNATSLEGCAEMVLVGGGVPTFAFGQAFAKSYHVTIRPQRNNKTGVGIPPKQLQKKNRIAVNKMKANGSRKGEANVLFVHKRHAKELKTAMDSLSILDRNYRMVKADATAPVDEPISCIAVPVSREGLDFVSSQSHCKADYPWLEYVVGSGSQVVPFSSVVLGRKG